MHRASSGAPAPGKRPLAEATNELDATEVAEHRHRRPSPPTIILAISAQSLGEGDTTMRTTWVVSWRGLDEEFPSAADAMDRMDQLEDRGIEAEMFEIVACRRRQIA
jgi:hypothetical protein